MPAERFDRSLAVVTGGASGIGRSIATALAAEGANVVVADVDMDGARRVAAAIDGVAAKVDVRDRASVAELFRVLPSAVDVLVTAAGGASRCGAMEIDDAVLLEALQLNACGFLRCAQEASRRVIAAGRSASIVHIASSLYLGPAPELAHYAAAKAASVTLVRCLAQELSAKSIRVNAVVPGPLKRRRRQQSGTRDPACGKQSPAGCRWAGSAFRVTFLAACCGSPARTPPGSPAR